MVENIFLFSQRFTLFLMAVNIDLMLLKRFAQVADCQRQLCTGLNMVF